MRTALEPREDSADPSTRVSPYIHHLHAFLHPRAGRARAIEQNGVEHRPTKGQAAVSIGGIPVAGREVPLHDLTVGRAHTHAGQLCRARIFDGVQRSDRIEQSRCFGAQVLGAGLVAGEVRSIEQAYVHPSPGQGPGGEGAGRPSAHYQHIVCPLRHETALDRR